ncbi:uncharacterized protein LOC141901785 isoform X1 [Tubulanus polymorphus]|uniref:uncharacterized protein LOC141901785 isoform X1 n=1 Tax=Tubulanus polymorphus TaxID=672921 RepID=UPI003DA5125B
MISHFFLVLIAPACLWACSEPEGGYKDPTIPQYVSNAKTIITGKVIELYPDDRFNYGPPPPPTTNENTEDVIEVKANVHTAKVDVNCVFKGDKTISSSVNISDIGAIPGMCIETKVEVGKEYIFAMSEHDGTFRLWHDTIDKNEANIEKLTKQCGLFSMPPVGSPDSETSVCPPVADPDSCELYTPPPPPVDVAPTKKTINENDEGPMSEEVPIDGKESSAKLKPEPVSGGDRSLSGVAASLRYTAFSIFSTVCLAILAQ